MLNYFHRLPDVCFLSCNTGVHKCKVNNAVLLDMDFHVIWLRSHRRRYSDCFNRDLLAVDSLPDIRFMLCDACAYITWINDTDLFYGDFHDIGVRCYWYGDSLDFQCSGLHKGFSFPGR
jgi:hypothetical protein